MKVRIPGYALFLIGLVLLFALVTHANADVHQKVPQHEIPDVDRADLSTRARSAVVFAVCGHMMRIYFVTGDGRQVQFRRSMNKYKFTVDELFASITNAALFDYIDVQGDFCPNEKKTPRAGIVDL